MWWTGSPASSSAATERRPSAGSRTTFRRTEDFPQVLMSERRYFHYYHIAKLLGVNGKKNRAKLPKCVVKRIAETYPDEDGTPTKVGYRQDAAE